MDIKNEIQHQISVYSGSEKRVIRKTMERCHCSEVCVMSCIDWLLKKEYVKTVEFNEFDENQKRFFESDNCRILKNIRYYDEIEFYAEEQKRKKAEEALSDKDKFALYFDKMEKEFKRTNVFNEKNYNIVFCENNATITTKDRAENPIIIDFGVATDVSYNEPGNSVFYKYNGEYFVIELFCLWGKCYLKHLQII